MNARTNPTDLPHCVNAGLATADHADMRRALAGPLVSLKPIEERLVRMHFGIGVEPRLMVEIAREMGISAAVVERHMKQALRKLKHPARSRRYRVFIMDGIEHETDPHDEMLRWAAA